MFSPFERLVALRYLRARKAEGFVSVIAAFSFLGIMLGVATLIIVMSVMNGFRAELFDRIIGLNGHMNVFVAGRPLDSYEGMQNRVLKVDGVESAIPVVEGQALLTTIGNASGVIVRGFNPQDFKTKPVLRDSIVQGEIENFQGYSVAIGKNLAEKLSLNIGDELNLTSPKGKASPFGTVPRSRRFLVSQIFDVGMYEYNAGFVFMPLEAAQRFFGYSPNSVTFLEVLTQDINKLNIIKNQALKTLEGQADIYDWRDANSSFVNALEIERNVMFLILTLIIVVAAFNIISSMIMLVKDKSSDIAIMRTMGATRNSMLKIFILTGASIGIAGTVVGAAIGILFAVNIETIRQWLQDALDTQLFPDEVYFLTQLPAIIRWEDVIVVIGMAVVLSILATLYPAWRAARLNPVEALRYG